MPAREGSVRRRADSSRARQPADLGGGGGAGGQRAGNARARAGAGSKPSGPQQFSPLSQPRMDYDIRDHETG